MKVHRVIRLFGGIQSATAFRTHQPAHLPRADCSSIDSDEGMESRSRASSASRALARARLIDPVKEERVTLHSMRTTRIIQHRFSMSCGEASLEGENVGKATLIESGETGE
jgi:hypothetical protein